MSPVFGAAPRARRRIRLLVAIAPCLAALAVPSGAVADGGERAPQGRPAAERSALIAWPRDGARLRARPAPIVVRQAAAVRGLSVRLNRRPIAAAFGAPRKGRRILRATPDYGLRHGRNVLVVRGRGWRGRWRQQKVVFRVAGHGSLAAAGRHRRVVVGTALDRRGRIVHRRGRAARASDTAPARYRWSLVEAPRSSDLRPLVDESTAWRADPTAPEVRFDTPGTYRYRLEVDYGDRVARASTEVSAVPSSPLVGLDTGASGSDGRPGIRVGERFFAADVGAAEEDYLQVLVLDRETLEPAWNRTYKNPGQNPPRLAADLLAIERGRLAVLASGPASTLGPGRPRELLDNALGRLGLLPLPSNDPRALSAVGVAGVGPGKATQQALPAGARAAITGYLTPDQNHNYAFVPPAGVPFDTRAAGSSERVNVIEVGEHRFSATLGPDAKGGFHVLVLDVRTLEPRANQLFETGDPTGARDHVEASNMAQLLGSVGRDALAVVQTVGEVAPPPFLWEYRETGWNLMVWRLQELGGMADAVNRLQPGQGYTLIGRGKLGAVRGVESSPPLVSSGAASGHLVGLFNRDRFWRYAAEASPDGTPPPALLGVAYQPPSETWPLTDTAAGEATMRYVACRLNLGEDVRHAYWIQAYQPGYWEQVERMLARIEMPAPGDGCAGEGPFAAPDLAAMKAQIEQEIEWVIRVRAFLDNLSKPFGQSGLQIWADLQKIAEDVANQTQVDNARELGFEVTGMILQLLGVASLWTPSEPARLIANTVAGVYGAAMTGATIDWNGTPAQDPFRARVNEIGVEVARRLEAAQAGIARIGDIIVSDYAKLRLAGTMANCLPGTPGCTPDWQWTAGQRDLAPRMIEIAARRAIYGALLPLRFRVYLPFVDPENPYWPRKASEYSCAHESPGTTQSDIRNAAHPFGKLPDSAQYAAMFGLNRMGRPAILALARKWPIDAFGVDNGVLPTAKLTRPLFAPITAGDGLGLSPAHFLFGSFTVLGAFCHDDESRFPSPPGFSRVNRP